MQNKEVTEFLTENPMITTIELLISDLNGILRGKRIERDLLDKVFRDGFYLPGSVMSLDASGTTVEDAGLGMAQGDRDRLCRPIPGTLAIVPWHESGERAQVLCTMFKDDTEAFFADPRQRLVAAVERFSELGFDCGFAAELEFYLIDPQRDDNGQIQPPIARDSHRRMTSCQVYSIDDLTEYDYFITDVIQTARAQNIPADTVIAEYAPGQFEVNLNYGTDIVTAIDQSVLLKRVIRNVAKKHAMEATFMAKPYIDESGNGLHMHLSLLKDGINVFAGDDPTLNTLMQHAVGGILSMVDSTQAFLTPNVNSFRRLAPDAFAPTSKTWGYDNRTVALRIPSGSHSATRIEHRMAGADANAYLAAATLIAGVTEGIKHKLTPPPAVIGNAYEQNHEQVADNQRDALRNMLADNRVADWFGQDFVDLYQTCKWHELRMFEQQVTPLEYDQLLPYS